MSPETYSKYLRRAFELMDLDPEPTSPEGQELIKLVDAIEKYESALYPLARVLLGV
jgi:hypothetical protein